MSKKRLDQEMLDRKLVATRSQARMLIVQGDVLVNGVTQQKPGFKTAPDDQIEIAQANLYVSRAAYKLEKAFSHYGLKADGLVFADIGASTGGFTQFLLQNGASKVYAIDVGTDQLHPELKSDPRVISMEQTHINSIESLPEKIDGAVVDLSFISVRKVWDAIERIMNNQGWVVVLIKPQFEANPSQIGKKGLVGEQARAEILDDFEKWMQESNLDYLPVVASPIEGKDGNTEYLTVIRWKT